MRMPPVGPDDVRPARNDGTCFYCRVPLTAPHAPDCILPDVAVRGVVIIPVEAYMPAIWTVEESNGFFLGGWCGHNAIDDLHDALEHDDGHRWCAAIRVELDRIVPGDPFIPAPDAPRLRPLSIDEAKS